MEQHSRLAPSSMPITVPCPGSLQAQEKFQQRETQETMEGTAAHWVASDVLKSFIDPSGSPVNCGSFLGHTAPNGVIVTQEMVDSANEYVLDVLQVAQQTGGLRKLHIEERIDIPRVHTDNWGTSDAWLFDDKSGILYIWDFKHGHSCIQIVENWQVIDYSIGIIDKVIGEHPALSNGINNGIQPDELIQVDMRIVQPRCFTMAPVRSWRIKASDLRGYANQLTSACEIALGPNPPTNTGPHCKHCTARHACKGAQQAAMNAIDVYQSMQAFELTPEALGNEIELLEKISESITNRLKGLKSEAEAKLLNGVNIPKYTLETKYGRKTWGKPVQEIFSMGDLFGVDLRKDQVPITPPQAIKKGIDKNVIKAYIHTPKKGLKLVKYDPTLANKIFGEAT